jgi:hypothetical protein
MSSGGPRNTGTVELCLARCPNSDRPWPIGLRPITPDELGLASVRRQKETPSTQLQDSGRGQRRTTFSLYLEWFVKRTSQSVRSDILEQDSAPAGVKKLENIWGKWYQARDSMPGGVDGLELEAISVNGIATTSASASFGSRPLW